MNMMTSKPQYGPIPLDEALKLAEGDIELVRNARLIARNGKPYISHRLLMIRLAEKQKQEQDAKRIQAPKKPGLLTRWFRAFVAWLRTK